MLRKVNKELFPYVKQFLSKEHLIKFAENPQFYEVETDLSSRQFNLVVEDAKCEKEREESSCPEIPVLSYRTLIHVGRAEQKLKEMQADCFVLLKCDEMKLANACL